MHSILELGFVEIMRRGGPVMWVLLGLSIVSVSLILERAWFWLRTNNAARVARVAKMAALIRKGDRSGARVLAESDESVYGRFVIALLDEKSTEAAATSAVETHRLELERFMGVISTIISAAPMLGLLGTVTGMISTFRFLSDQMTATDPRSVGLGLSEAMINTASGLAVAIVALFPYNAFRVQVDRTLSRFETLVAAAAASDDR